MPDAPSRDQPPARDLEAIAAVAGQVRDPELPMLTLADLGVLRGVGVEPGPDGEVVVASITPTYSGCPATAAMRGDLLRRLRDAGCARVEVRLVLDPPWSSDWISARGREALRAAGISPPGPAPDDDGGPVPLTLLTTAPGDRPAPPCPRCGCVETRVTSRFGPTACTALYVCTACLEPFEHLKEI